MFDQRVAFGAVVICSANDPKRTTVRVTLRVDRLRPVANDVAELPRPPAADGLINEPMPVPMRQICQAAALAPLLLATLLTGFATADEIAFKEHCAKCHPRPASVVRGLRGKTAEERSILLHKFLATHHAEDAKLRADITNFLIGLSEQ